MTPLCQDYAMVRHLPMKNFRRILDKTLSIMAPDEMNASIHTHICVDNG